MPSHASSASTAPPSPVGGGGLGFGVPPFQGVLGSSPPHVRVPGVPIGQIWGALGFGVPHFKGSWGPCWSDLGSGGAAIWGVLPHIRGSWGSIPHVRVPGVPIGQIWGVLGFGVPHFKGSWGPFWSDLGGSGIWGPRISRGLWIPVGQIWGPPPHIRGSWGPPPMSEVLGSLSVRFGGLWDLGSPLYKRFWGLPPCSRCWGPCWSHLGGLWDLGSPHVRGPGVPIGQI